MTGEDVKVSIIVPIFNNEDFLEECLDSLVNQSMKEIEIICVDDASTDKSAEIIRAYAQRDSRIRSIHYESNRSASQGRKDGVLLSQGEYVLFVDGDDFLEQQTCEELYQEMEADPVDILHFGTRILNWTGMEESRIEAMNRLLEPYQGRLEGSNVFEGCFREGKYGFNLWNKLYDGTVCRKAISHIEDGTFPKAQDKYAFFVISYFAQSYRGINKEFYTYRFGSGVTGHITLDLNTFERYCTMGKVADAIERFADKEGLLAYTDVIKSSRMQLLNDVLANWARVKAGQRAEAFDTILQYWNVSEVIGVLASKYWYNQGVIAQDVKESSSIKRVPRKEKVRTIGTHYIRLYGGGAQKVTAMLANIWQAMGYQVVMFTDCEESANDYYLAPGIERVVLPACASMRREDYKERAIILEKEIKRRNIDVMVYHPWVSNILLWDMLVCKLSGAAFIVQCHNVFPMLMRNFRIYFAEQTKIYQLCDAISTLSDTDRRFWSNFNSNVYTVKNPLFFDPAAITPSSLQSKNIVWIGRFSTEKHPEDALAILRKVVTVDPEVKLYMLGEITETQRESYGRIIQEMGLENNVELVGYLADISPYLGNAGLQLMTSEYEGLPLALLDGMAYGLPCVMYELPYVSITQDNKAIVSVKYKDIAAAADEILNILGNIDKRISMGKCACEYIRKYAEYCIEDSWQEIFSSLEQSQDDVNPQNLLMLNTLVDFYEAGAIKASKGIGGSELKGAYLSLLTRKAVFWGSGRRAHRFLNAYPELNIAFCIDNDASKEGGNVNGVPIVHAANVKEWKELFIIVTVVTNAEITSQLERLGLQYGIDYVIATDILELKM